MIYRAVIKTSHGPSVFRGKLQLSNFERMSIMYIKQFVKNISRKQNPTHVTWNFYKRKGLEADECKSLWPHLVEATTSNSGFKLHNYAKNLWISIIHSWVYGQAMERERPGGHHPSKALKFTRMLTCFAEWDTLHHPCNTQWVEILF